MRFAKNRATRTHASLHSWEVRELTLVAGKVTRVLERAMVVTVHPDDAETGAGGTVAGLVRQGVEITYVIVTSGNMGSGDRTMTPDRLARIREAEQRNAAHTLRVKHVEFLGYDDGEVAINPPGE